MARKVKESTDFLDRLCGFKSATASSNSEKTTASATAWDLESAKAAASQKLAKKLKSRKK